MFLDGGYYVSRHHDRAGEGYSHVGLCEWDGSRLVLWETGYQADWQSCRLTRYDVEFGTPKGYHLTGKTPNDTPVVLSKIPPWEE